MQTERTGPLLLPAFAHAILFLPCAPHSTPRATVEREIFDVIRPLVFEVFSTSLPATARDKFDQLLEEIWWPPSPGMPSPFEQRYEGFGCDMAVAVLNLLQAREPDSYFSN